MTCRLCAAIEVHRGDPVVARLVDRLLDELTVVRMLVDTPRRVAASTELAWRRRSRKAEADDRAFRLQRGQMLAALQHGPLRVPELVDEIFGPPVADADEQKLRVQRTRQALVRAQKVGEVVRVGHGWYARPGVREGMQHVTRGDCLKILADPKVQPAGGLTTEEIAERLDIPLSTARFWMGELIRQRADLVRFPVAGQRGGRLFRYRLDQEDVA